MKSTLLPFLSRLGALALFACATLHAEFNNDGIYTKPRPDAGGGITGKVQGSTLTHAVAIERDRTSVYRGKLSEEGSRFSFEGLPSGKYDLLLLTRDRRMVEGLMLGEGFETVTGASRKNFEIRVEKTDAFFNKHTVHRCGLVDGGEKILALIERWRDRSSVTAGGEDVRGNVRRFEIVEFDKAADDWSVVQSRHLWRELDPVAAGFQNGRFAPELSGVRVITSVKDLGALKP